MYFRHVFLPFLSALLFLCCSGADDFSERVHLFGDLSRPERVINFSKHLFGELGRHQGDIAATLTPGIRAEYAQLEEEEGIPLGTALAGVAELRIMDLEISLRHTRRLLEAVQLLGDGGGGVI